MWTEQQQVADADSDTNADADADADTMHPRRRVIGDRKSRKKAKKQRRKLEAAGITKEDAAAAEPPTAEPTMAEVDARAGSLPTRHYVRIHYVQISV